MDDSFQQVRLYQLLSSLGKVAPLQKPEGIEHCINKKILSFESHFKYYNPRKEGYNRYGLSITSREGDFSHTPDLDSLMEYNKEHGTHFDENDFRKWTPFFKACTELNELMIPFHKYIGRSHILRLNRGGFFPFHRDGGNSLIPRHFRLLIALKNYYDFVFILDDERIYFEPGRLYFVDTRLSHAVFSFEDKSDFVVFNIDLCEDSVKAVMKSLFFK